MTSAHHSRAWFNFMTFVKNASDTYSNHTKQVKLEEEKAKQQNKCPKSYSDHYKTLTFDELQSLAPFFNWTRYINNQLPNKSLEVTNKN